ncbi:zinc-binding dehydrogenase [Micromonospora tarensis]|uniref:zinc-binding dehydrogenase n=1 Tax=Micromonospora tarensis TaxID=2806100 RepID=UPI0028165CDB|nr:zinc-binding dehydrogenase [Micromonospora tarensis]
MFERTRTTPNARPHITRTFTFDQSAEALAAVETSHTAGKLVLRLSARPAR